MPWNSDYCPNSMKHLPLLECEKAIETAKALLEQGMGEGKTIRVAIAKTEEWARHHPYGA